MVETKILFRMFAKIYLLKFLSFSYIFSTIVTKILTFLKFYCKKAKPVCIVCKACFAKINIIFAKMMCLLTGSAVMWPKTCPLASSLFLREESCARDSNQAGVLTTWLYTPQPTWQRKTSHGCTTS